MADDKQNLPALKYGNRVIHEREGMISLTDMWRAAGSPPEKRPADWLAQVGTKEFVACVEATLDAGIASIQSAKGGRGIGGNTFAHWQISLAYARYLSPPFHMWANSVVRERMQEGRATPQIAASPDDPATVLQVIQYLQGKVDEQSGRLTALDRIEGATGSRCITDTAKMLKMGRDALHKWMQAQRWIYRRPQSDTWVAFSDKERAGLLESVPYHYTGRDGTPRVKMQVLVTPKGLVRLAADLGRTLDDGAVRA